MSSAGPRRLGPYELLSPIGEGGMGEVWKARDTRLDRTVAVKISKEEFSERFEREARSVAALNHPHICTLHDVGPNYLVMEYIEGKPLQGPLPVDQAIRYARQMADALDTAHKAGIIHRDLKPANILLTKTGIKLLDFGLAKQADTAPISAQATVKVGLSQPGMIMGTPQYMSPEQVEGVEVDARSDIFSFGLVLYELITGKPAFEGKSAASIMASILRETPPAPATLVPVTPAALDRIVLRCLAKEPEDRYQSARDLRHVLEDLELNAAPITPAKSAGIWPPLAIVLGLLLVAATVGLLRRGPPALNEAPNQILSLLPPPGTIFNTIGGMSLSPDGQWLAFGAGNSLWVRNLQTAQLRELGIAQPQNSLFWSRDSRRIGFFNDGGLSSVDLQTDNRKQLARGRPRGGTWNADGQILLAGIQQWQEGDAKGRDVTNPKQGETHYWPWFLPDGKHYLYTARSADTKRAGIFLASLAQPGKDVQLLPTASKAEVVPASGGYPPYLLYVRDSALLAQALNPNSFQPAGDPVRVASPVGVHGNTMWANFTSAPTGSLVFGKRGTGRTKLVWLDRNGSKLQTIGGVQSYSGLSLSPDNQRVFVRRAEERGTTSMWMLDLARGVTTQLLDFGMTAAWSPDGTEVVYIDIGTSRMLRKRIDDSGPPAVLRTDAGPGFVSWSPNGQFLYAHKLFSLSATAAEEILTVGDFMCSFAPDSRWMVCSTRGAVTVYSVPDGKTRYVIASEAAFDARWSPKGNEIFYRSLDGKQMISVAVRPAGQGLAFEAPQTLFRAAMSDQEQIYEVSRDGQRFLTLMPEDEDGPGELTVMTNWRAAIRKP